MLYENTSELARRWNRLQHPGRDAEIDDEGNVTDPGLPVGSTLFLQPGEQVELDLIPNTAPEGEEPNGFDDPYLKPVPAKPAPSRSTPAPLGATTEPAAEAAPDPEE